MALKKKKLTDFGVDVEYHKIDLIQLYTNQNREDIFVQIGSYVDENIRRGNFAPLQVESITLSGDDYFAIPGMTDDELKAAAYVKIKQRIAFFSDAIDA